MPGSQFLANIRFQFFFPLQVRGLGSYLPIRHAPFLNQGYDTSPEAPHLTPRFTSLTREPPLERVWSQPPLSWDTKKVFFFPPLSPDGWKKKKTGLHLLWTTILME